MMRIVCVVEVQIPEIQIDGLISHLNDQQINYTRKKYASLIKGTFLLLREGVTSPMRAKYMVKFYSSNHYKIQEIFPRIVH